MKKVLAAIMSLAVPMAGFTGIPVMAEEADPIQLTAWCWDKNVDAIAEAARQYTELTGVQIELTAEAVLENDIKTAIITASESGDTSGLPDIILLNDREYAGMGSSYRDLFFDVTDYVDWTQSSASKTGLSVIDGAHLGIPLDSGSAIAMYRTDILEQAGYTIDDMKGITWNRAIEIGADVYEKTGYYLYSDNSGGDTLMSMITSSGMSIFNEDGSANVKDNEVIKAAIETIKKAVEANALYISTDWNDYIASFTGGEVAAGLVQGCWVANNVNTAPDQAGLWDMADIPALDDIEGASHYTNMGGSSWAVLATSEHPEVAAEMLSYIFAGEGMMTYVDYMTNDIGYITTYAPIANSDYFNEVKDTFYSEDFWSRVAATAANAPVFVTSPMYAVTTENLKIALQEVLAGTSVEDALITAQDTLDFEFEG